MPMHKYHSYNPKKGQRFFKAMNSVAQDGKSLRLLLGDFSVDTG